MWNVIKKDWKVEEFFILLKNGFIYYSHKFDKKNENFYKQYMEHIWARNKCQWEGPRSPNPPS